MAIVSVIFCVLYLYFLILQCVFSNIFVQASILLMTISFSFAYLYKVLIESIERTKIYIHPITRANKDSTIILELFPSIILLSFMISLWSICGIIPTYWQLVFALVTPFVSCQLFEWYEFYVQRSQSPRKIACFFCKTPFQKHQLEINDFLTSNEIADNQAGITKCNINTALCLKCSYPLTRETIGLNITSIGYSKYHKFSECLQCKDYFRPDLGAVCRRDLVTDFIHPLQTEDLAKSIQIIASSKCRWCGYYSQSFPTFTLSSMKDEMHQFLTGSETRRDVTPPQVPMGKFIKYYSAQPRLIEVSRSYDSHKAGLIVKEIEDMLQRDSEDNNYLSKKYSIIDHSDELRKIKFLSANDKRQAIRLLNQWTGSSQIIKESLPSDYI
jgi:hypothetical protein